MQEIIFSEQDNGHILKGFRGVIVSRRQPGVYVPHQLRSVFKPKTDDIPATRAYVERRDDPKQHFVASVSRAGDGQAIVCAHIKNFIPDPRFPPGTACFVRIATAQDET